MCCGASLRVDGALLNCGTQAGCDSVVYQLSFYYLTIAYSITAFGCIVGILGYCHMKKTNPGAV